MKRDDALQLATKGYEQLAQALSEGRSEELERYLSVMSRFHQYSFRNCLMIVMQRAEATHVAGYRKWEKLGRHVRKGEKAIGIFAPLVYRKQEKDASQDSSNDEEKSLRGFKVVHVFDVAQTEGEPLPEFASVSGDPGVWQNRLEQVVRSRGIELAFVESLDGANGVSRGGRIEILESLPAAERFTTLVHEIAHETLHRDKRRHETTKTIRETEAEAVGFVVAQAVGLDAVRQCADYISLYQGDTETLGESMQFIQRTAADIIKALHECKACDHALQAFNDAGQIQGTWSEVPIDDGVRIECSECGKFYGNRIDPNAIALRSAEA